MVELQQKSTTNGAVGEAVWVDGMRKAGLSEEEIDRVVTVTATLDRPTANNGDGGELVPVKEAAVRIGRSENTVRSWIRLGHLQTVDRPPPPEHANGPWVYVDMDDVEEFEQKASPSESTGELITLRQAAERFNITLSRLRSWCQRGHLKTRGHRAQGRTSFVFAEDVAELIANPPRPTGRPPKLAQ